MSTVSGKTRTVAAVMARRRSTQAALQRVEDTLELLRRNRSPLSVAAVARQAGVSRTFLYDNQQARALWSAAIAVGAVHRQQAAAEHDVAQQAIWRERALNAEAVLKAANTEILSQRARIGELLGHIRDLQDTWTDETITRVTTENTALKQRVRQLSADNRGLQERLAAARSNLRFNDRRLADLEARLAEHVMAARGGATSA